MNDKMFNSILTNNNKDIIKNSTVNKIINIYNRTPDQLKTIYEEHITPSSISGGIEAMAEIMVSKTLKDIDGCNMITISDKSRKNCRYKLESGEIISDIGCNSLISTHRDIIVAQVKICITDPSVREQRIDQDSSVCIGFMEIVNDDNTEKWRSSIVQRIN